MWVDWVVKALLYEKGELKIVSEEEEHMKELDTLQWLENLKNEQMLNSCED